MTASREGEWAPGTKNENGVYCPHEELELYRPGGGWMAAIKLARTVDGWRAYRSFSFFCGNWWGSSGPITDHCTAHPTREAAIKEQVANLHRAFAKLDDPSMQKEAQMILEWADNLCPAQMEMFA